MYKLQLAYRFLIICLFTVSCTTNDKVSLDINLIPYPNSLHKKDGHFSIKGTTLIIANEEVSKKIASQFTNELVPYFDKVSRVEISDRSTNNSVYFSLDTNLNIPFEGYRLNIDSNSVLVLASSESGLFYGMQSLIQLFTISEDKNTIVLPALDIDDAPQFSWRGMHLDVSRHFMPVSFIKKYIDYLAMNKLNIFHWHLVDGTGWRIEIKSHPELTDIGAWRVVKDANKPWKDIEAWREGDDRAKYGGFYTQDEIKEVVKYAQDHYVTVLPEIELPGHSEIIFDCFPDLVCKDDNGNSLKNIGVYCASNPKSYQLLEDVLDEIITLFPSEYIHIGGDEVNKSNWMKCANCQKLMSKNNFDEKKLQSHFVNHFDKYLLSKGRKLMGWHEILEGELSPSANIMYWGGIKEFEDVLRKGHPTVLTTGTSYYFDHYQSASKNEPKAFGGFSPLRQVYDLNPTQGIDTSLVPQILGLQANVWTEYMKTPERVEYMIFPRLFALAENAWTQEKNKSWTRFRSTTSAMIKRYQKMGVNCSLSAYRPIITTRIDSTTKKLNLNIESELDADIYYTLDGSVPDKENGIQYDSPLLLDSSRIVNAISIINSEILSNIETKKAVIHKARACKIKLKNEPYSKYAAQGAKTLLDLDCGSNIWGNGKWLGFLDKNLDATIQLDHSSLIKKVTLSCIAEHGAGIYFPDDIQISVSNDGENYRLVNKWAKPKLQQLGEDQSVITHQFSVEFETLNCNFLRVVARCPTQEKAGTFIFIDEIIVE